MSKGDDFDLMRFLPYVMNQAAEVLSLEFQANYKGKYGMLRTEWRVLFHLGQYGEMTAKQICEKARLHKTKVSRAATALENKRYLIRSEVETDRRHNLLRLTKQGESVFQDLCKDAQMFDVRVRESMSDQEVEILEKCLVRLAGLSQK